MERKLKIILCVVAIILITLISFLGVYTKDAVIFKNKLPKLELSSDFEGKRVSSLIIDDGTEDIIFDKDGKEVESIPEDANKEDYKTETKKINADENYTAENYKKAKEILDGRLSSLGVNEYNVRLDENTGKIGVELEENFDTDTILLFLASKGDFEITDSKDGNVLLNRDDLKGAKVLYNNTDGTGVTVYLAFQFNKEGTEKLKNISNEYVEVKSEGENEENNPEQKQVTLSLEGTDMLTTHFAEEINSGELTISLGKSTDSETLQDYIEQASFYAALLNNDEMPLKYKVDMSEVMKGNLAETDKNIIFGSLFAIGLVIIIYLICRYRVDGIFAGISFIGGIAMLILVSRYTSTEISLNAAVAIIIVMLLEGYLLNKILQSIKNDSSIENIHKATVKEYLKHKEIIIVTLIISIVFTFMQYVEVFSFGMALFYGVISIAISNLLFLRTMLLAKYTKN